MFILWNSEQKYFLTFMRFLIYTYYTYYRYILMAKMESAVTKTVMEAAVNTVAKRENLTKKMSGAAVKTAHERVKGVLGAVK